MSREIDEAIKKAALEVADTDGEPLQGYAEEIMAIFHKHLDPILRLPEGGELPVEVTYLPVTAAHQHLRAPCLGFDLQIAADFINRVGKEYK